MYKTRISSVHILGIHILLYLTDNAFVNNSLGPTLELKQNLCLCEDVFQSMVDHGADEGFSPGGSFDNAFWEDERINLRAIYERLVFCSLLVLFQLLFCYFSCFWNDQRYLSFVYI